MSFLHSAPRRLAGAVALAALATAAQAAPVTFNPGDLVVSGSVYAGSAGTITIGQSLPGGGKAVADGSYPNVFKNEKPDASFGITSPIFLQDLTTSGSLVKSIDLSSTAAAAVTTSFSSKSELGLNLSTDGTALTFMGYVAPVNSLDVSNSNTPGHVDPTNPVKSSFQRAVVQVNGNGSVSYTPVNDYSGNNGRNAILADGNYYMVGNAGNGSGTEPTNIVNNTGVQLATPGESNGATTPVGVQHGTPGSSTGFQYGYSVTQNGDPADKSGKDDNFRGETIFDNTLYVTKGSGSNGIDTVYQVGLPGSLPDASDASSTPISILPGFPTDLAKAGGSMHPFGLFFGDATTLYVADEGDGAATFDANNHLTSIGSTGGLQKWSLVNGTWEYDYTLTLGLNLGHQYNPANYNGPAPATDGLRNLTGRRNADGTVTLVAVTSTVSALTDQGADPDEVVEITDKIKDTTLAQAAGESFSILETASSGEVFRGVSFAPSAPDSGPSLALLAALFAGLTVCARPLRRASR